MVKTWTKYKTQLKGVKGQTKFNSYGIPRQHHGDPLGQGFEG